LLLVRLHLLRLWLLLLYLLLAGAGIASIYRLPGQDAGNQGYQGVGNIGPPLLLSSDDGHA